MMLTAICLTCMLKTRFNLAFYDVLLAWIFVEYALFKNFGDIAVHLSSLLDELSMD